MERVLGAGGMGAVVAAYHMQFETRVALKFLFPAMLAEEEASAELRRRTVPDSIAPHSGRICVRCAGLGW